MSKTFTRNRQWLNPVEHEDTGAISWHVEGGVYEAEAEITIRDCDRQIKLDFGARDKKELNQRIKKLNMLIDALEDVKQNLGEAFKHYQSIKGR